MKRVIYLPYEKEVRKKLMSWIYSATLHHIPDYIGIIALTVSVLVRIICNHVFFGLNSAVSSPQFLQYFG